MMNKTFYSSIIIFFFLCEYTWSAQLQLNTQTAKNGDIVTFTVFIHDAPDPVNAFGFDITYDPTCMTYKSVQRGVLISDGFRFFKASNVGFGHIRIGGIETGDNIIPKQAVGSLALIQFNVIGEKNSFVRLENLKDDLKIWTTQDGQLIIQAQETDDDTDTKDNVTDTDEEINDNSNSISDDEIATTQQIQTTQETTSPPNIPYMITNDDNQTKSSNHTFNFQSQDSQDTFHGESQTIVQSKAEDNQRISQQFKTKPNNPINNLHHEQKLTDHSNAPHAPSKQNDFHKKVSTETLTKRDWGHVKSVDLSAGFRQDSAVSQNHILTFPSFLSTTIVISMIIQLGILIMLILIYQQLSKNERR